MIPKAREQLRPRSDGEMSLGQDPDLIARYLAGEDVSEQLLQMESADQDSDRHPRPNRHDEPAPLADVIVIDPKRAGSPNPQQPISAPGTEKRSERPTLALIALAVALAVFAVSIWIALR